MVGRGGRSRHASWLIAYSIWLACPHRRDLEFTIAAQLPHASQRRRNDGIAACLATERGVEVCAPVHDAFLICSPLDRLEADVAAMRECMAEASRAVLGGFEVRTDVKIVRYPDRYADPRGAAMWDRVMVLIAKQSAKAEVA